LSANRKSPSNIKKTPVRIASGKPLAAEFGFMISIPDNAGGCEEDHRLENAEPSA
jgi:hypothetical protein